MQGLLKQVREMMDLGVPPQDPRVQALAKQWNQRVEQSIPDIRLLHSFSTLHRKEASVQALSGVDNQVIRLFNAGHE